MRQAPRLQRAAPFLLMAALIAGITHPGLVMAQTSSERARTANDPTEDAILCYSFTAGMVRWAQAIARLCGVPEADVMQRYVDDADRRFEELFGAATLERARQSVARVELEVAERRGQCPDALRQSVLATNALSERLEELRARMSSFRFHRRPTVNTIGDCE